MNYCYVLRYPCYDRAVFIQIDFRVEKRHHLVNICVGILCSESCDLYKYYRAIFRLAVNPTSTGVVNSIEKLVSF